MHYQTRQISSAVFRAYDIRGIVGAELNEDAFYTIGKAISRRLKELNRNAIFLARDGRLTSDSLAAALKAGLLNSGIDVVDLGAQATPVMYYATFTQGLDCGLVVTGSHNPADHNGIKMVIAGKTLVQADIEKLYTYVVQEDFIEGRGNETQLEVIPHYVQRIISDIHLKRSLKVVVDCGNGIAGSVIPTVIRQLGCEVVELFCEVDGSFPNHHPDPSVEVNLKDLKDAVLQHKADIGLAFDGDADRLGLITNSGSTIWPDRLMMLFARALLSQNPKSTIVFDVKCSSNLPKIIEEAGGIAKMCPTGHSIVKGIMKESGAALAGEMSGHLFFKDRWYGFDDALYSACRLLEIISNSTKTVDEQFAMIPDSVNTPEIKIPISDALKFDFMQQFIERAAFPQATISKIDGIRVEFSTGWGLLRASNTTPCLVARFEAQDLASLEHIKQLFKVEMQKMDLKLELPF